MSLTSTVPGALSALETDLQAVATANPSLDVGVYLGVPIANVTNNYLAISEWETGELIVNYRQEWAGLPANPPRRSEEYGIPVTIRAWAGDSDPQSRIADLFTLVDGVLGAVQADPQASGALTSSGSWQATELTIPESGPLGGKGFGVVAQLIIEITNVRLTS